MMLPPLDEFKAKELDDDLIWSRSLYLTHCEHRSRKQHRKRHDRLAKISKATQRLMVLLSDDGSGEPAIRFPLDMQSPTTYLKRILATVEAELSPKFVSPLDIEIEGGKHLADALGIGRLSAFEWLVGERLPQIYEKYYRRRATARGAD